MRESRKLSELDKTNSNQYAKNHPRRLYKDMKDAGCTEEQLEVLFSSLNARGINKLYSNRAMMFEYERSLKNTVKAIMQLIVETKAEMFPAYVYPSEVEKGTKTIYDYVKYVNLRTNHVQLKMALSVFEEHRADMKDMMEINGFVWWNRKKKEKNLASNESVTEHYEELVKN